MIMTTGAGPTLTIRPHPLGEAWGTVMESNDPWYRLFRALADLFLAGEIDEDELYDQAVHWLGHGERVDHLRDAYPAAAWIEGKIALACMEPDCLCDSYREQPCGCPPMDRRARLRDLMGV